MHRPSRITVLASIVIALPVLVAATGPRATQGGTPGSTTGAVVKMDIDIGLSNLRHVTFWIAPASDKDGMHGIAVTLCDAATGKVRDTMATDVAFESLYLAIGTSKTATLQYIPWGTYRCATNVHIMAP
jgi:hypothetical protein